MTTTFAQPPTPSDAVRVARSATAQLKPTAWLAHLAAPVLLGVSFLRGNAHYWTGRGLPWLILIVALQAASAVFITWLSRNVTRIGAEASSGDPDTFARLLRRVHRLPETALFPVLLLNMPALFLVLLAPALADIGRAFY